MKSELFDKLNSDINLSSLSSRCRFSFNDAKIDTYIKIYRFQEEHHGYPISIYSTDGLRKLSGIGRAYLGEIERHLASLELPDLRDAKIVIREFDEIAFGFIPGKSTPKSDDELFRMVLKGILKAFGKRSDLKTIHNVMKVINQC